MKTIVGDLDYIRGILYGGIELRMSDSEYGQFEKLSEEEKKKIIEENGNIVIDDWKVNDYGTIENIEVYEG